jgi:transposase-like protein
MPWQEASIMDQRREFVRLAMQEQANRRELCRRFGIHPDTGYKWLSRWASGDRELCDRSRRPHASPARTEAAMESLVLQVRDAHPAWGARKIARCLQREGVKPPEPSTVHEILRRHGRIVPPAGSPRAYVFEDFRFHMTLTGPLGDDRRTSIGDLLSRSLARACGSDPLRIDRIALLRQDDGARRFRVVHEAMLRIRQAAVS